jgi:hypothetical protein
MLKRLLIILLLTAMTLVTHAQSRSAKDLLGRWRTIYPGGKFSDLQFITDSTGAFLFATGLLSNYISYRADFKKDIIALQYTIDINRKKHRNFADVDVKFLNDSTFLMKFGGSFPEHPDSSTNKLLIYHKLKFIEPGTELRFQTSHDLAGKWSSYHNSKNPNKVVFTDDGHVVFKINGVERELNYNVDFTKQPIPIDFYSTGNSKVLQAFLIFDSRIYGEELLWIELYPGNNRGDHFEMLGHNGLFKKDTTKKEK